MKVYPISDEQGRIFAFQVRVMLDGRRAFCKVARSIPGVRHVDPHGSLPGYDFCEFTIGDVTFSAEEPFGDNSRYWVGPRPPRWVPEVAQVLEHFRRTRVFFLWVRTSAR